MNHTITKKRPYSFNALLSSLSSQVPDKQATWEQNLSLQAEKFYGQHSIQKKQENAAFIPTQRMLRDLITGTASSGGDLVATSVQKVADSVRPVTVLERGGVERIETGGENLTIPRFAKADAGGLQKVPTTPHSPPRAPALMPVRSSPVPACPSHVA